MDSLFQNITHALGWGIVHSLWQGLLLYSIICLLYVGFPKLSSRNKYTLAFCAQLGIFATFAYTFYHYLDFASAYNPAILVDLASNLAVEERRQPIFGVLESLFPWFSSLYVIGLLVQLILFTNSYSKLHYLRTRGLRDVPTLWLESFKNVYTQLGLSRSVRFFLSEKIPVPITLGHLNPIILFPIALVNNLDIKQVESILIHELAHIKRYDYFFNLLKVVMETILFFNPFAWLLSKHIDTEREYACDDIVIQCVPSPIAYAQALMSVEINSAVPAYALAATGKNHHLLHRIQRITKMEKKYTHVKQHLFAVALSTLALATIAWIAPSDQNDNVESKVESISPLTNDTEPQRITSENICALESADRPHQDTTVFAKQVSPPSAQKEDTVFSVIEPIHAPALDLNIAALKNVTTLLEQEFNSERWKEHIANLELNAQKIEEYYASPEWKSHIAEIEENARKVEDYYNSPEWKDQITKIEENARKVKDYYNTPEWKNNIAKIEENAKKVEDYYNSPEWKDQIAKIEEKAKKIAEYYESAEWKEKVKKQAQDFKWRNSAEN